MPASEWLVGAAAILAGAIAAVSGFGIGSLLTPILMLSMPTAHAVAVLAIPHVVATTIRWLRLRSDVDVPTFKQFGVASAVGGLAGAALQSQLASPILTIVLASLLILAGTTELMRRRVPLPRTPFWRLLGGILSGVFGGLVGNQGGIRAAALLGFQLRPRQLVATATASALLVDAARVPIYFLSVGPVVAANTRLWIAASLGVTIGTFLGVPVLSRIPESTYRRLVGGLLLALGLSLIAMTGRAADVSITIDTPMKPPRWALLERQLLADNVPASKAFFDKYFDDRGYLQCYARWGANDGPDDAFENFNRWPELHALGASDDILKMYSKGHEGLLRQYTEAKTTEVPIAREGMYHNEFIVQSDWMHHGEGLQLFNRMALSMPADPKYQERARRFAGLYMGEDPSAPNYDPAHKIIRSMQNGSKGPMLRKATALDWVGDPFDVKGFDAEHGESTFDQFLAHYQEYTDVVGDHFLNLAATTLATNAYLIGGEAKYKTWLVGYMDAWLDRMRRNGGVIPSFVDLDGSIGGPTKRWWGNAYGWGFSPVNPVTGKREDRNRIQWAVPGFFNVLLVTGDRKYVDAWRAMIDAVNAHARDANGKKQYPTMHGAEGWYGWRDAPWDVGALEVWYWSQASQDLARVNGPSTPATMRSWVDYLQGKNASYPEQALERDLNGIKQRLEAMRKDTTPPEKRLADNMLDYNPAATESLVQLMWGALMPGRPGGLLNARLRYFDPDRRRAGVPEDVAALVSELSDTRTAVTLVNVGSQPRTVIVQGGGYGEHQLVSVTRGGQKTPINAAHVAVRLAPGSGETLMLEMKRYANTPTVIHPWQRGTE